MKTNKAVEDFHEYVAQTSDHSFDFEVESSSGVWITSTDGRKYLDFTSGVAVNSLGCSNPKVIEAVKKQLDTSLHTMVYGEHIHPVVTRFAQKITDKFPWVDDPQVFFVNSGNEANDLAIKMARKITGRKKLVAIEKSFHGRGYGAMQVTWNEKYREGFFVDDGSSFWLTPDSDYDLQKFVDEDTAAVIVELVRGEAGSIALEEDYVADLYNKCKQVGALFIVDEVQTGFYRTGSSFLAQEPYRVAADITTLGKAMGGGLPIGGVVAPKEYFELLQQPALSHVSTFGGNPVCCAAGEAVIDQMNEPEFRDQVLKSSQYLDNTLYELRQKYPFMIDGISGRGMMRGLWFLSSSITEPFVKKCNERGLLLMFKLNNPRSVRISPALNITPTEISHGIEIMDQVLSELQ